MRSRLNGGTTTSNISGQLRQTVTFGVRGRAAAFVYLDQATVTNGLTVLTVTFDTGTKKAGATIDITDGGMKLHVQRADDDGQDAVQGVRVPPPMNVWFELALVFDFRNHTAHVEFDGVAQGLETVPPYDFGGTDNVTSIDVGVGLESESLEPPITMWFDDVTLVP